MIHIHNHKYHPQHFKNHPSVRREHIKLKSFKFFHSVSSDMWPQKLVFILLTIEFCKSNRIERFRPIQPQSDALVKGMSTK